MTPPRYLPNDRVRLTYFVGKRFDERGYPQDGTVIEDDGEQVSLLLDSTGRAETFDYADVYAACGCSRPRGENMDRCIAHIHHGPGHQSHTHCRLSGEHETHEAVYGASRQFVTWRGDEAITGFFDDPPDEEDDDE